VEPGGRISGSGFSPMLYSCKIEVPGCTPQSFPVRFEPGKGADLGIIRLEMAKRMELIYVLCSSRPFDLRLKKRVVLSGGDTWHPTSGQQDLVLSQHNGALSLTTHYLPCQLTDLGAGKLEDFAATEVAGTENQPHELAALSGHVYLLKHRSAKDWVLFRMELK